MNLMLASHECTCADMLRDLSLVAGLVRREPLGRGLDRRCEVGCLLHLNFSLVVVVSSCPNYNNCKP